MEQRVLVAYASKHGSTAEIAQRIGAGLARNNLTVEVKPVDEVDDVTPYQTVVVGSAVYIGRWQKQAATFLTTNAELLAQRQVWLFSSGPTGADEPDAQMDGWRFPTALQPIADQIGPHDIALFRGVLNDAKLNVIERFVVRRVKAPVGDFRDWEAIDDWAAAIAALVAVTA